jgi:signal peptidase I
MENSLESFRAEVITVDSRTGKDDPGSWRFIIDLLETAVLSLILFFAINAVSARIRVDGYSMEPTLHSGEFVVVNKLSYKIGDIDRGDVVVFHFPRNPEQEYIKRVIGLPSDQIVIKNGVVFINGFELEESYIRAQPSYNGEWTVTDDGLFVLGDNRNNSSDSHNWGEVPLDLVVGKAVFVYWPPTEWGRIDRPLIAKAAP